MFRPPQQRGQRLGAQPGAVADRAGPDDQKAAYPPAADLGVAAQRPLDGGDGVLVGHVELHGPSRPARTERHPPLDRLAVQHDLPFAPGQLPERDVKPDAELAGRVLVQPARARVPRQDGALLDGLALVGDEGVHVDLGPHAQAVAGRARAIGVEREGLSAGRLEVHAAHRAHDLHVLGRDRRLDAVPVWAQRGAQPGHHQAQDVQDLRHGPDRAARAGHRRALAQRQRGWQVADPVDVRAAGPGSAGGGCRCSGPPGNGACPRRRGCRWPGRSCRSRRRRRWPPSATAGRPRRDRAGCCAGRRALRWRSAACRARAAPGRCLRLG